MKNLINALNLGVMRDAAGEGAGAGGGEDEAAKAAAATAAAEAAAAKAKEDADKGTGAGAGAGGDDGAGDKKPSDTEAKLLKEVMEKKAEAKKLKDQLAAFGEIDPAKVRELLDGEAKREAARKKAELTTLEQKGEFERVKAMMAEENKKLVEAALTEAKAVKDELNAARAKINDLTVGVSFANSSFVKSELVLTPAKARALYGSHFDLEDGQPVAYDKPATAKERTKLVDASGEPLAFDAALAKIIDADPERDTLKRSKVAAGAGSNTTGGKPVVDTTKPAGLTGVARIQAALAAKKDALAKK